MLFLMMVIVVVRFIEEGYWIPNERLQMRMSEPKEIKKHDEAWFFAMMVLNTSIFINIF